MPRTSGRRGSTYSQQAKIKLLIYYPIKTTRELSKERPNLKELLQQGVGDYCNRENNSTIRATNISKAKQKGIFFYGEGSTKLEKAWYEYSGTMNECFLEVRRFS